MMTNEKMSAELMDKCWEREHVGGLKHGEVQCNICYQIYPIGEKHPCKASVPSGHTKLDSDLLQIMGPTDFVRNVDPTRIMG